MSKNSQRILICLALAVVTFILFWPVKSHEFINYDDPDYVSANPATQAGLTWAGIKWAFTTTHSFNWHPLTWISHMLDFQFFGNNPGAHHLVSVFFHLANALLIFWLLQKMTGAIWRSAFVAAVFALHPLHVESVAWACERKDVLSTFFGLLAIWCYADFTAAGKIVSRKSQIQNPKSKIRYGFSLLFFALSLLAKPMLVTLPFIFLLLDLWPLRRFPNLERADSKKDKAPEFLSSRLKSLVLEKVPFFALTIASSVATYIAQKKEGAVVQLEYFPMGARIANALVSYVRYLGKTFCPTDLTIYYEPRPHWDAWKVAGAALLLISASVAAVLWRRKRPYIFFGWFWFLGTLVPVIGLVQVGAQSIAERYMYVPMIGLSIALTWLVSEFHFRSEQFRKIVLGGISAAILIPTYIFSQQQIRHWKNSETIFRHALAVDPKNLMAHVMLANAFCDEQKFDEAELHYTEALKINFVYPEIHYNLGNLFVQKDKLDQAAAEFKIALEQNPNYIEAHANLAVVLSRQDKFDEAIAHEQTALQIDSRQPDLLRNMAIDFMNVRRFDEATEALTSAIALQPGEPTLYFLRGNSLAAQQKFDDAAENYSQALRLKPDFTEAQKRLENVLARKNSAGH